MTVASAVDLRPLTRPEAAAAAALSEVVGWNQNQADWERLMTLNPSGALGAWSGSDLLGTATLVSYGRHAAWLGMVIVAPSARGRGLGSLLVDAALASNDLTDDAVIGLDATELGAPLYARRGFEKVALIDRWSGVLASVQHGGGAATRRAEPRDAKELAALDFAASGVDRSRLLEQLLREPTTTVVLAEDGAGGGYGVLRSGLKRSHLGPLVASSDEALAAVVAALAVVAANAPIYLDAVRRPATTQRLEGFGLSVSRTLWRMTRPARPVMSGDAVVAATAFEWG